MSNNVKRTHTIEEIKEIFRILDDRTGENFSNIDIKIDGRLKNTLGSCIQTLSLTEDGRILKVEGKKFRFSRLFLETPITQETFVSIIIHEYTHLYTNRQYLENCEHNEKFVDNCLKLGIKKEKYVRPSIDFR